MAGTSGNPVVATYQFSTSRAWSDGHPRGIDLAAGTRDQACPLATSSCTASTVPGSQVNRVASTTPEPLPVPTPRAEECTARALPQAEEPVRGLDHSPFEGSLQERSAVAKVLPCLDKSCLTVL